MSCVITTSKYPRDNRERGFVMVLFSILLACLMTFVAFSVDLSRLTDERLKIQIAADAASFAAVSQLGPGATYESVAAVSQEIAAANLATNGDVFDIQPRCGTWANQTFTPQPALECDETATSVEVTIQRSVPLMFGRVASSDDVNLLARSVSYKPLPPPGDCIRPFGIEDSFLRSVSPSNGSIFTVRGTQESGNWGKIDLDGNSSSGTEYTYFMTHNLCDEAFARGSIVSAGTGNAQIWQVFRDMMSASGGASAVNGMVFAVTTDFGVGNSSVEILRFIRVSLVSQRGSGQNWQASFRMVEVDAEPDSRFPPARQLMQ